MVAVEAIKWEDLCWGAAQCQAIIMVYGLSSLVER
jgi:hypothetical protein